MFNVTKLTIYKLRLSSRLALNRLCLCVVHCQAYLPCIPVLDPSLSVLQAPASAQVVPPHPWLWPHRNLPMQITRLFIATQCPCRCLHSLRRFLRSYHQILWQQCSSNSHRSGLWCKFQHQYRPPRTTAPRTLRPLLWLSNTPPCSPQGLPSHYFSRYHRATSSQPGYKVFALRSPSILPCLKPLPCLVLRGELSRWILQHLHPPPSRWGVVRH